MTTYELATSIPREQRNQMSDAGIFSRSIERYIYIFELFNHTVEQGHSKMDAYTIVSGKCFTCEENVRKIIQKMNKEVQ